MKIITIRELVGIPKGSVIVDAIPFNDDDGVKCWRGLWVSMYGTYTVTLARTDTEVWDPKKHDPLHGVFPLSEETKASPAYKKLLDLWKRKDD